ncbi:hypothetical protein HN803_05415 [candidate division WWE3 bacterium]|jgi:hypothetical protein|nr:hypothetical protein [candidate division WWE3 bacterium]MBT7350201.1 hypothetical protein [candidate division WWE3 bacterium]
MVVVPRESKLWEFFPEEIKGLIADGEHLLIECHALSGKVSDYSYLVFPFAKAYEGFLKHYFLELELIHEDEFYGDDIRIGRILNPMFMEKKFSVYAKLKKIKGYDPDMPEHLWKIWRRGRNQVFHYFPHNFRRLSKEESADIINGMVGAMHEAVAVLKD